MEFKSLEIEEEKGVWESFYNIPEQPILTQAHQYIPRLLLVALFWREFLSRVNPKEEWHYYTGVHLPDEIFLLHIRTF